jgi:hypothetical protein
MQNVFPRLIFMFIFFCRSITLCAVQYCTVYVNVGLFGNYKGRNVAFLTDSMRQVSLHRGGGQRTGGDGTVSRKRQDSEPEETEQCIEGDRKVIQRRQGLCTRRRQDSEPEETESVNRKGYESGPEETGQQTEGDETQHGEDRTMNVEKE